MVYKQLFCNIFFMICLPKWFVNNKRKFDNTEPRIVYRCFPESVKLKNSYKQGVAMNHPGMNCPDAFDNKPNGCQPASSFIVLKKVTVLLTLKCITYL